MTDVAGNRVKEVLVSEATRAAARGKLGPDELRRAVEELRAELAGLATGKSQIQARLCAIRNQIRGKYLPPPEYSRLTAEQTKLVRELHELEARHSELKVRFQQLGKDGEEWNVERKNETNLLLKLILRELRKLNAQKVSNPAG